MHSHWYEDWTSDEVYTVLILVVMEDALAHIKGQKTEKQVMS